MVLRISFDDLIPDVIDDINVELAEHDLRLIDTGEIDDDDLTYELVKPSLMTIETNSRNLLERNRNAHTFTKEKRIDCHQQ